MPSVVILGWGSLLWDVRPEFSRFHGAWELDGPILPLEFSRISATRERSLTLVLDEANGSPCQVAYARSTRRDPDDVIADLRCREGTLLRNVGCYFRDSSRNRSRSSNVFQLVEEWAAARSIDSVVWTDLPSNFESMSEPSCPFSTAAAVSHLRSLPASAKAKAAEYIWRAPDFVSTPLRSIVQAEPWFTGPVL